MPEITLEQVEELERLALAATPGKRDFFSDGIWTIDEGGYPDFNILWIAEDMNGRHYVGVHEDDVEILTLDAEAVLALCKALRQAREALARLKKQEYELWCALEVHAPNHPLVTDGAILEAVGEEPEPPRTCPRCGELLMPIPDEIGGTACVGCGFVVREDD